ncbi:MAG: putative selenate reductase subunit YgfK [bacterium]|nr:putative selenate reductase subunit YgfK [bacterium]
MSGDKFWGCDIETLLKWILEEEKQGQIFGIRKELFFIPNQTDPYRMRRYGQLLETPLGVAAGPHTQLSQNLIAAWLAGARYMELKTIQVLDELEVTKPCIDMTDEGYNCEWSQELKLDQSFDEYLNAWIVLHILKDKFGWGLPSEAGFIFNMSVGYNLEGILSPTVQRFLDRMADCSQEKAQKIEHLSRFYPRVKALDIPDGMSDNITISTMHGCPPDEVEKIGHYFVTERKLNTTIKLNPTLLGPQRLRGILNQKLGFETVVPDLAFEHDLKYADGVALIRALLAAAEKSGVAFNIKLTNTLETSNQEQNLPKSEQMVYMSGRALHPISINLAACLQAEFDGALDISFSAGTDCLNFADLLACNLKPVTVCSDVLKPGGYGRLSQYLETAGRAMQDAGAASLEEFVMANGREAGHAARAGLDNLQAYAVSVVEKPAYKKERFPYDNIKTPRELSTFDCIQAPCLTTCPVSQDIPGYMYHTARGEYDRAFRVIMESNPFPNIQGMVCDHLCQEKCTRLNYDAPLLIREIKRFIAQKYDRPIGLEPAPANGIKVAVIGAGPSGLACAHFMALAGFEVHIYEQKSFAGGWASDAIPQFRLDAASIKKDIDAILSLGVQIHYNAGVDAEKFASLRQTHAYVYIGVGAQEGIALGVPGEDAEGVMDQLEFLSAVRRGERPDLGKKVAVIGGGNSAMDAARTAKRLVGADGEVSVLYRRTRREMPAAPEEIQALLDEGVHLVELTAPECMLVEGGRVTSNLCFKMELGEADASGRPRPIKIDGSEFELNVDSVIPAIGQRVNVDFFPEEKLEIDPVSHETQLENVFAGGDAVRGASTLIKAIGDGKKVAESIRARALDDFRMPAGSAGKISDSGELHKKRARRQSGIELPEIGFDERRGFDLVIRTLDDAAAQKEAARCLYCDEVCNVCVTVCPNRANVGFQMDPTSFTVQEARPTSDNVEILDLEHVRIAQTPQVLNIGDYCNECGNCTTFCPTSGSPYLDKAKFHVTADSFAAATLGYYFREDNLLEFKQDGHSACLEITADGYIYESEEVRATLDQNYAAQKVEFKGKGKETVSLRHAAEMAILSKAVRGLAPLNLNDQAY